MSVVLTIIERMIKLKIMRKLPSNGQALLIILLIMAVALTIGLSVISRSITDVKISQQTEESARAFSAAEAGIEESLVTGSGGIGSFTETGASYQVQTADFGDGATQLVFPQEVSIDEPQTLWLARHDPATGNVIETAYYTASNIDVCWGGNAALEVSVYYKDGSTYKVARGAYDPDGGRRALNNFDPTDGLCPTLSMSNRKSIGFTDPATKPLLFLRLRTFYNNAQVGVVTAGSGAGNVLPSQGTRYESTGTAGAATRKVEVVRYWPVPPPIFDFVLSSGGGLTK